MFYAQYPLRTNYSHFVKQFDFSVCDSFLKAYYELTK